MIEYKLSLFIISVKKDLFDLYRNSLWNNHICSNLCYSYKDGFYWLSLMTFTSTDESSYVFRRVVDYIEKEPLIIQLIDSYGFSLKLIFEETVTDFEEDIIGFSLLNDFLSLSILSHMSLDIVIDYKPEITIDEYSYPTSGVYFYAISNEKTLDLMALNKVAGTEPTRSYRRGDFRDSGYLQYDNSGWCVEFKYDNEMPNKPIEKVIDYIKNPKELGQYCMEHNILTQMELTFYGIYNSKVMFSIESDFLSFCQSLNVRFLSIDIMA